MFISPGVVLNFFYRGSGINAPRCLSSALRRRTRAFKSSLPTSRQLVLRLKHRDQDAAAEVFDLARLRRDVQLGHAIERVRSAERALWI